MHRIACASNLKPKFLRKALQLLFKLYHVYVGGVSNVVAVVGLSFIIDIFVAVQGVGAGSSERNFSANIHKL